MKRFVAQLLAAPTLAAMTLVLPTTGAATASGDWGRATAKNQTLQQGCHGYAFSYRVETPGDAWMAEITLVNPNGRKIATHTYDSGADARTGVRSFRFCSPTTRPGVHTIRLKVTSYEDRDVSARTEPATTFILTR